MRKIFSVAVIIGCIIYAAGCSKTIKEQPANAASEEDGTSAGFRNPYGVLVSESNGFVLKPAEAASLARDLGVAYARISITNVQWYNPTERIRFLNEYNSYAGGTPSIKLTVNVSWTNGQPGAVPYPGATPEYQAFIKNLTDTLVSGRYKRPAVIMIEDEENNPEDHVLTTTADLQKYLDMLSFATTECHAKRLKIANGGLSSLAIHLLIWNYYENIKLDHARAELFLSHAMPPATITLFKGGKFDDKKEVAIFFAAGYKNIPLDYVNMHWYEPVKLSYWRSPNRATDIDTTQLSAGVLESCFEYFNDPANLGGKQLICNEAGQLTPANELPQLLTCAMQALPIVIWYSGDRQEVVSLRPYKQSALHTTINGNPTSYSLRANGIAFRDNILNIRANPFVFCPPVIGSSFKPAAANAVK